MKKAPAHTVSLTLTIDDYEVLDALLSIYPEGQCFTAGTPVEELWSRGLVERVVIEGLETGPAVYRITPIGARAFGKYNNVVLLQRA
jgi:hypothetical protein